MFYLLPCFCSFPSDDYVMIFQGGRKLRRLSGVYSYGLFGWRDDDDKLFFLLQITLNNVSCYFNATKQIFHSFPHHPSLYIFSFQ